jgi:DNA mismatch repair protein MutL
VAQTLIVNNRPVADPVLRTAVKVAYRDVITFGRHAIVALYLDVPPDELDVNVHPAKTELRFRDGAAVRSLVIGSVRRALGVGTGQVVPMTSFGASPVPSLTSRARSGRVSYPAPPLSLSGGSLSAGSGGGSQYGNLAEAQLPFMAGPSARQITALAPSPDCPMGRWCWSISMRRTNV